MVRAGELCHSFLRRRWVSKYIIWKLGGVTNSRDSRDFSISLIFNLFNHFFYNNRLIDIYVILIYFMI